MPSSIFVWPGFHNAYCDRGGMVTTGGHACSRKDSQKKFFAKILDSVKKHESILKNERREINLGIEPHIFGLLARRVNH